MIIRTKNTILRPIKKYNIFYEFLSINFNKNTGIFKVFYYNRKMFGLYTSLWILLQNYTILKRMVLESVVIYNEVNRYFSQKCKVL